MSVFFPDLEHQTSEITKTLQAAISNVGKQRPVFTHEDMINELRTAKYGTSTTQYLIERIEYLNSLPEPPEHFTTRQYQLLDCIQNADILFIPISFIDGGALWVWNKYEIITHLLLQRWDYDFIMTHLYDQDVLTVMITFEDFGEQSIIPAMLHMELYLPQTDLKGLYDATKADFSYGNQDFDREVIALNSHPVNGLSFVESRPGIHDVYNTARMLKNGGN